MWGIDVYLSYGPDLINKIDKSYGYKSIFLDEWSKDFPMGASILIYCRED